MNIRIAFRQALPLILLLASLLDVSAAFGAESAAKVYVVLWFDTEDYLLPSSDDAALRLAKFLSSEDVRATFKVVGEKARTLERRKRTDVVEALKRHEIGFHSNYHSTQPSPALYLSQLGWDEGVHEFDRREGPGRADVERLFGQAPSCYGQPGSSWGPQSYGAMDQWGMGVYLDAGSHVNLNDRPCYYCGILNLYKLAYTLRADLNHPQELPRAEERFAQARKQLLAEGGGVVSIFYHPCEFVHKKFWDGVNFSRGANPPREQWKEPPAKTAEETRSSYRIFEEYVRFIKRFPEVRFITASEAAKLYCDRARNRRITAEELSSIAKAVGEEVSFQIHNDYALSASEVFALLNAYVADDAAKELTVRKTPLGPTGRISLMSETVTTDASQFQRTCRDVADYLDKHGRIPSAVWLGSRPVPPEAYLATLARIAQLRLSGRAMPQNIDIKPAKLAAARYVSDDDPKKLWGWVIFPPGFRAPALMDLAKKQAWTLKPAILERAAAEDKQATPLPQAHSHNDYEHKRPLLDALEQGFCSVEADVYLVGDELLIGHTRLALRPERTLEKLYLAPLRERVKASGGRVYRNGPPFYLLIDVKTDAKATYAAVDKQLARYGDMLSVTRDGKFQAGAITVVISGNRDKETITHQKVRYAGIDGRPADVDSEEPAHLMPWISADWRSLFHWKGDGPMPAAEREKLNDLVGNAHKRGRMVRFWSTPEEPEMWKELLAAKVDLLNADRLAELRRFLIEHAPPGP